VSKKAARKKAATKKATKKKTSRSRKPAPVKTPPADQTNQVMRWILTGATEFEIRESIAATYPQADADRLIAAAMGTIMTNADNDPDAVRSWCFEAARDIYRKSMEQGDTATALRALKTLDELA